MLDPSTLSGKGVFTRICVLYYLGTILAVSYLNVRLLEFLGCYSWYQSSSLSELGDRMGLILNCGDEGHN